jgi:hypothetical protein
MGKYTYFLDDPWHLKTLPGTSDYTIYLGEGTEPPVLVCEVGKTTLLCQARCVKDLVAMLTERRDGVLPGNTDEQK